VATTDPLEQAAIDAAEQERTRLGRMLHDSLSQSLNALQIFVTLQARRLASAASPEAANAQLLKEQFQEVVAELHDTVAWLAPVSFEPDELPVYLGTLCQRNSRRIPCQLLCDAHVEVPKAIAHALYTMASEGVLLFLGAESVERLEIGLTTAVQGVTLRISGQLPRREENPLATESWSWRLLSARAESIGAQVRLDWSDENTLSLSWTLPNKSP
jgi:signal transduction histidine kinase